MWVLVCAFYYMQLLPTALQDWVLLCFVSHSLWVCNVLRCQLIRNMQMD